MKKIFLACLLLALPIVIACGQSSIKGSNRADTTIIRNYLDSLSAVRQKLDNDTITSAGSKLAPRLFEPTTFYHDITNEAFRPYYNMQPVSLSLLSIYLSRPDLVGNSQRNMEKYRGDSPAPEAPIQSNPNLVNSEMLPDPKPVEAPVDLLVLRPRFWSYKGDYSLQLMQNYVSGNWYKGGESSYAVLGAVTMEANYNNRQKVRWDNKLELKLGMQNTRSDSLHTVKTTEDLIRLTSKLGLQASHHWYYTLQLIGQTQFTHSYKSNDPVLYAHFLAPGNLNISIGMDYNVDWINHRLTGTFHLAPFAYNMKYTRLRDLAERLGIDKGKHFLHDKGSQFTIDLTWEIADQLRWKTRMYGYTTYKRVEYEWENTLVFQFNKWISAQLFVYPRFDDAITRDGHHGYWQYKEFSSIGFTYVF